MKNKENRLKFLLIVVKILFNSFLLQIILLLKLYFISFKGVGYLNNFALNYFFRVSFSFHCRKSKYLNLVCVQGLLNMGGIKT